MTGFNGGATESKRVYQGVSGCEGGTLFRGEDVTGCNRDVRGCMLEGVKGSNGGDGIDGGDGGKGSEGRRGDRGDSFLHF